MSPREELQARASLFYWSLVAALTSAASALITRDPLPLLFGVPALVGLLVLSLENVL